MLHCNIYMAPMQGMRLARSVVTLILQKEFLMPGGGHAPGILAQLRPMTSSCDDMTAPEGRKGLTARRMMGAPEQR